HSEARQSAWQPLSPAVGEHLAVLSFLCAWNGRARGISSPDNLPLSGMDSWATRPSRIDRRHFLRCTDPRLFLGLNSMMASTRSTLLPKLILAAMLGLGAMAVWDIAAGLFFAVIEPLTRGIARSIGDPEVAAGWMMVILFCSPTVFAFVLFW